MRRLTALQFLNLMSPRILTLYLLLQLEVLLLQIQYIALKLQIARAKFINMLLQLIHQRPRFRYIWLILLQGLNNPIQKRYGSRSNSNWVTHGE